MRWAGAKRRQSATLFLFLIFNLAVARALEAAEPGAESHFQKGRFELSLGSGILFSPFVVGLDRPTLDYTLTEAQLGYMLTAVRGLDWLRGNVEAVGDAFGGGIVEGRGHYVSGATLWLRYNLVPRTSRFAPFAQGGAGLVETDLDRRIEGENFNFNLDLAGGVRCFLTPNCSLNLEYRYQHISNAGLARQNAGINAEGPMLSISYFF